MSADPNPKRKPPAKKHEATPVAEVTDASKADETINTSTDTPPQPADTQMEVHHHPELPHGEKKRFKEYVLEGLMIFIAVTMGFFAESLREHINEHDREIQYMKTFAQDLQTDSANICLSLIQLDASRRDIHELIMLMNSPQKADSGARMYYDARISTKNLTFHGADRTLTQLKNSGGYSVIKNKAVVDSITTYEGKIERYMITNGISLQESQLLYPGMAKVFKAIVFESMVTDQYTVNMPAGNPQLLSNDPILINELTYFLHQRESTLVASTVFLKKVQASEKSVHAFLEKEYKLDE